MKRFEAGGVLKLHNSFVSNFVKLSKVDQRFEGTRTAWLLKYKFFSL